MLFRAGSLEKMAAPSTKIGITGGVAFALGDEKSNLDKV